MTACSRRHDPDAVIEKIHADVGQGGAVERIVDQLRQQAMEVDLLGPEAYRTFLLAELAKFRSSSRAAAPKVDYLRKNVDQLLR